MIEEQVTREADPETAKALLQAVPPEQQWAGLDRFLSRDRPSKQVG
jgi:hypothetical protein